MLTKDKNGIKKLEVKPGDHILVIAAPGEGKTLCAERIAEEYNLDGYTIVIIENAKSNLESAFCIFPPKKFYHLNKLRFQDEQPRSQPIKIYHPYTPNFPKGKLLYPHNIWTANIKRF